MRETRALGFLTILLLGFPCTRALAGEGTVLEKAVQRFLASGNAAERVKSARAVLDLDPRPQALEALMKKGRMYKADVPRGWVVWKVRASDGVERSFHFFVPESYDPARRWPLLIHLHCGVVGRSVPEELRLKNRENLWGEDAKKGEFILVRPWGDNATRWWTKIAGSYVLGALGKIKRTYNVDENRVFCAGFSDGGSGSFFFALNYTTPFAGFVPLSGFVPVAREGGLPIYPANFSNKPLYIVNTGKDSQYPAAICGMYVQGMKKAGANVIFRVYEEIDHSTDYWPQEHERVLRFLRETSREPAPKTLKWETSDPEVGRCHWVKIEKIDDVGDNAGELKKKFGRLSGRIHVRCEGNRIVVRARCVARYALMISRDLFDVEKPVEVLTNGRVSFKGIVKGDPSFMLDQTGRDDDRSMVFWGKIEVDLRRGREEGGEEEDF